MRRLIGRIIAWFLRDFILSDGRTITITQDEYVQIQKASFESGLWKAQVRVFTKDGTLHKTVVVADLNKALLREAASGN